MKKMRVCRLFAGIGMLLLLTVGFFPCESARAEQDTAEVTSESDWVTLTPEDSEEAPVAPEEEWEDPYAAEHARAAQILADNLSATGMSLNGEQRIYDFYGKFSAEEQEEIGNWIIAQELKGNISIRVFVAEMDAADEKYFLEECTDALCDNGYAKEDMAIMLLNLDAYNRGVCIQGYGLCEIQINDDRIEYMLDDIIEWFLADDYVYGVKLFAQEAAYYMTVEETVPSLPTDTTRPVGGTTYVPYYKDNSFKGKMSRMPWTMIVIVPVLVAGIGIFLMVNNNGSKKTTTDKTYMENDTSGLTAQRDDYIRTSVSKSYSPRSSGSSGSSRSSGGRSSGGGGRSGGGRSHSGGSRRF